MNCCFDYNSDEEPWSRTHLQMHKQSFIFQKIYTLINIKHTIDIGMNISTNCVIRNLSFDKVTEKIDDTH